jgi:very-short-patch-repair endonuclease
VNPGDLVYHPKHGTARLLGNRQIDGDDFLALEFAGGEKVYVPARSASMVERVPDDGSVRVDRLRKSGPPPAPPRSLIMDRASRSSGGPGIREGESPPDPLLEAARSASPQRRETVERAADAWIARLIDLSRRNRLLYFQPLKVRTVELSAEEIGRALPLLSGEPIAVGRLFPQRELVRGDPEVELDHEIEEIEEADLGVIRRLQEIQKRGDEDFEERGLETVHFAYGMATWRPEDQGRPPEAPVVMVPITVTGTVNRLALHPSGDPGINLVLTHVLEEQFGCEGLTAKLEDLLASTDEVDPQQRAQNILDAILDAAGGVPGFTLHRRAVIGNFAFQKLAMVRDLQRWRDRVAGHDLVSAVAGDLEAKREVSDRRSDVDPRELDSRPPDQEFLVMDADSSQQRAIASALKGESGVIIGPPGTGKSQTIANLIGELISSGKRVLFVAEKRAALDVVKSRLQRRGLGDLVLDLHGALSRKQIMSQFSTALAAVSETPQPRVEDLHAAFVDRRQRLNEYVERLHRTRQPTGDSAYELFGQYLALQEAGITCSVRWKGPALAALTRENVRQIEAVLGRAAGEPNLFLRTSRSPWTNADLRDREAVEESVQLAADLSGTRLPNLAAETEECVASVGLRRPADLERYQSLVSVIQRANELLDLYSPDILALDLAVLRTNMRSGASGIGRLWSRVTNSQYRATRKQLLALRSTKVSTRRLLDELDQLVTLVDDWQAISVGESRPAGYPRIGDLMKAEQEVVAGLARLGRFVGLPGLDTGYAELTGLIEALVADRQTPSKIPAVRAYESELEGMGAEAFVSDIRGRDMPVEQWVPTFHFAWLASCREQLLLEEPELAVFNGNEHEKVVEEFKRLDRDRLEVAIDRVRRAYAESVVTAANQHRDQELLVKKQAALRSRHLPFRELARRAPEMVTAVKPCWMASPLAVSQLLGGPEQFFDVVIFDEASQVLPEDAVTSILRGRSVVVAGDPSQLPPTRFFAAERDEEESDPGEDTEGFESILDVMLAFLPRWTLDWHYRSRDERLIAFSNHYVYDDHLITFPSANLEDGALTQVVVTQRLHGSDAEELSSSAEVVRVAELILEHATRRPEETLGVIAMGVKHSNRIDAELARARRERPELDAFFDAHPEEKFFVKNLERVQGDERDAIILSIGYGKDSSGKLPYRFGPLLTEGGYRRLNVAVTRAKARVILVSSFSHLDMDPARSNKMGVELLRHYLQYASTGGEVFGDGGPAPVGRNEFEIQVQTALERAGLQVVPQLGASMYRIDMAVQHPDQPGRYVLAVECDGATYHSSPTARDRDRLRQEHLEARGWRFVRIWSTDWFTRRDEEVARVLNAYHRAILLPEADMEPDRAVHVPALGSSSSGPVLESTTSQRGQRPAILRNQPITEYSIKQLASLARWIQSDGRLRTDDQLVQAMMADLGFTRRSRRIEATLREGIQMSK